MNRKNDGETSANPLPMFTSLLAIGELDITLVDEFYWSLTFLDRSHLRWQAHQFQPWMNMCVSVCVYVCV